jgi:hypothetical protein
VYYSIREPSHKIHTHTIHNFSTDQLKALLDPLSEKSGLSVFHILAIIVVIILLFMNLLGFDGVLV